METTWIFRENKKSTWKQRRIFDQRNYTEKVCGNDVDFSTIEITSKRVRGNNVDFLTSEITSKKVRGNDVDFWTNRNYIKKVRGNDVEIRRNLVFDVSA